MSPPAPAGAELRLAVGRRIGALGVPEDGFMLQGALRQ